MSKPGNFLITLSGARPDILALCPGEKVKFQSLGWAISITSGMAVVSMWFALTSAMGVHPVAALPIALLWGLVIMGIDRWLVTSLPHDGKRKLLMASPRLILAILLGSLISTPLVLRVFETEINSQISVIQETNEANFLNSQQHSAVQARVATWQNTVKNLNQVIGSRGSVALNPAADPVVQGLTSQLATERKVETQDYHAWQCQLYGGCGAPIGSGPLAQASEQRYQADKTQVASLTAEIAARELTLQDNSAASAQTRLAQANAALPNAQAQLAAAQAEEDLLLNNFQLTNKSTNGLLIRLQALDQLTTKGGSLSVVRWLLFLLFLVIEILPVSVRLLQQPGPYEELVRTADQMQVRHGKWLLRDRNALSPASFAGVGGLDGRPDYDLRPSSRDAEHATSRLPRDLSKGDLMRLFGRTEGNGASSRNRPADRRDQEREPAVSVPEPVNPTRVDEEMENLTDARPVAGFGDRFGSGTAADGHPDWTTGIERRYGDDEL